MSDRALFIGREVDAETGKTGDEPVRLEPDDLTTHGLIVGMTGSGKTALGIVLIEELLQRGVPVLAIDPKGDLANLLLDFPGLSPEEFAPFVDTGGGATAESEAKKWREGLASWGLGPADVARLLASREAGVYSPGGSAGTPLDILGSLAPPSATAGDEERREVSAAFLLGLLGLAGIDADPVRSREFILLSQCVEALWEKGETATPEALVGIAAAPPFATVGALPLESFFPSKERQELVLSLNNLVASPTLRSFRRGEPLSIERMLGGSPGKAKLSIVSVASLSERERIFTVATVLSRVAAYMRTRPGSSSLRALVYVDEIFGFFPPTAEPPTKRPLLTLLKQARAFGIGVVLATQNPADLDYKGLANCGCWWVGTLQAERDRKRLEEGLSDAAGTGAALKLLSKTRKRVFLLHDVHRKAPALVETRWAMSYLKGPMTREEIEKARGREAPSGAEAKTPASAPASPASAPVVPGGWPVRWVDRHGGDRAAPYFFVRFAVRYRANGVPAPEVTGVRLYPLDVAAASDVLEADALEAASDAVLEKAPRSLVLSPLPAWFGASALAPLEKSVRERLPDKLEATLLFDPVTKGLSAPGESAEAFAARISPAAAAPAALRERLEKKRRELEAAESQEKGRALEKWASVGTAAVDILGGLLGRRKTIRVGKVGSVLTKQRMEGAVEAKIDALKAEIAELEAKVAPPDPSRFESIRVVPLKAHVDVLALGVAWVS